MIDKRRRFDVIPGGGEGRSHTRGELLAVPEVLQRHDQLMLTAWANAGASGRLLSVGFDALDYQGFHQVLSAAGVRHVVDVRLLASFRGRGFAPDIVDRTFRELGVTYVRCHDLANTFSSSSTNQHLVQLKYRTHLREEAAGALSRIANLLLRGTVLLLGRDARHFGSDRELLVDCLAELHRPIELVVFSTCQGASLIASSFLLAEAELPTTATKTKKPRRPKKRAAKSNKRQLAFPNGECPDE